MERQSKLKGNTAAHCPRRLCTDVTHKDVHYSTMLLKNILQKRSFSKCYLDRKQWQLTQGKGDTDELRSPCHICNTASTQYLQGIGSWIPLLPRVKSMDVQVPLYKMAPVRLAPVSPPYPEILSVVGWICRGGTYGYSAVLCLVAQSCTTLRLHGL